MWKRVKPNGEEVDMKEYLCIEDGEHFIVHAKDWEEAQETAAMYNAKLIEEMP